MNKSIKEKAIYFLTAMLDVYRDEDRREFEAFSKLEFDESGDVTGDITAMLLAMQVVCERLTGYDGDIIDFTHLLNRIAVQYVMENSASGEATSAKESQEDI